MNLSRKAAQPGPEPTERLLKYVFRGETGYGLEVEGAVFRVDGNVFALPLVKGQFVARVGDVKILSPCTPTKIVGVGHNFASRLKELGIARPAEPLVFLKPPSSMLACYEPIILPAASHEVSMESELAIIIGRKARNVAESEVPDCVLGYTAANDITASDIMRLEIQATRSKSFDGFCPLGPFVAFGLPERDVFIEGRLNGTTVQRSTVEDMVFSVREIVSFVSTVMTLEPGDVILTGTPAGVTRLQTGDIVEVEVQDVGTLQNTVS